MARYVVATGEEAWSRKPGKAEVFGKYRGELLDFDALPELPDDVDALLSSAGPDETEKAWISGTTEGWKEKVGDKLRADMEAVPAEGKRSDVSYSVMCRLFELGLTDDEVLELAENLKHHFADKYVVRDDIKDEIVRARARWKKDQTKGFSVDPEANYKVKGEAAATGAEPGNVSRFIGWPDADDKGKPYPNRPRNVAALLQACGAQVRFNVFTEGYEIAGSSSPWAPLADSAVNWLWATGNEHGLNYKVDSFLRLLTVIADGNRYHPVLEYLGSLKWDGKARLDRWLPTYLGAEDTELNRASGRVTLIGAVRRVLKPGCKHDTALVLEGPQGSLKSTAVAKLGGQFYSDGLRLGQQDRETMEQTSGAWIIEVAEMGGMSCGSAL